MDSKLFMLSTGKVIEVPVYMENRDGLLYNSNTHRYEALEGDWGVDMESLKKEKLKAMQIFSSSSLRESQV